ncbi:hypothetical protein Vadar_030529 [Vaccinium darrowii]|uniref:Uncharacterized protein n=1 Tax=Vaccinium darrowii TaxID=229202 RepID=A0ACB7YZT4_9ERIC|nr:hypothetical protein Vadar_030529 [Vaccinium darrowii]
MDPHMRLETETVGFCTWKAAQLLASGVGGGGGSALFCTLPPVVRLLGFSGSMPNGEVHVLWAGDSFVLQEFGVVGGRNGGDVPRRYNMLSTCPHPAVHSPISNPKSTPLPHHQTELFAACSSKSPPIPTQIPPNPTQSLLHGSTRTITTLCAVALLLPKLLASEISLLSPKWVTILPNPDTRSTTVGPLFFAAISDSSRSTGAPIAVIAKGLARRLQIYSCVLLIRVLLSWFPNIDWDKQPMSAIRDLCDPYLSLFKGIIPPLNNSLDVNPLKLEATILPNPNTLFLAAMSAAVVRNSTGGQIAVTVICLAWLGIYSCDLLNRVLLSWFRNIQWDKQPISAIQDMCDPFWLSFSREFSGSLAVHLFLIEFKGNIKGSVGFVEGCPTARLGSCDSLIRPARLDKQPMPAIWNLLSLFRGIIPPFFNSSLDVSGLQLNVDCGAYVLFIKPSVDFVEAWPTAEVRVFLSLK